MKNIPLKLNVSQLKDIFGGGYIDEDGKNIYVTCPYCGHNEAGVSIKRRNHPFNCFRKKKCGVETNIFGILKHLGRLNEFVSGDIDVNIFSESLDISSLTVTGAVDSKLDQTDSLVLPEIKPPIGWKRLSSHPYLESRRLDEVDMDRHYFGQSFLKKDYITILIHMNSVLVGYLGRSLKSEKWIKEHNQLSKIKHLRYDNSVSDFSKMLGGYDDVEKGVTKTVFLVEGYFDMVSVNRKLGLNFRDDIKCCCTFGGKLSDSQILLLKLKDIEEIYIIYESDIIDKIKKVLSKASHSFSKVIGCYLPEGKDPDDMDADEIIDSIEAGTDFLSFSLNFVQSKIEL